MSNRQRCFRSLCALVPFASAAVLASNVAAAETPAETGSEPAAETTTVTVTATNLRSAKGVVRACMTTNPKRFPKCRGDENAHSKVVPAGETVTFKFTGVKPGNYAIALLHDENNNGKADRALMMMPKEGFGFSRDAKVRMGPPKFKSAAFDVSSETKALKIKMRYML